MEEAKKPQSEEEVEEQRLKNGAEELLKPKEKTEGKRPEEEREEKMKAKSELEFGRFMKIVSPSLDPVMLILRSHLFIEYYLRQFIIAGIPRGDIILDKNFTFMNNLTIVKSLDVIPAYLIHCFTNLNTIRNRCSHVLDYKISEDDIDLIGRPLGVYYLDIKDKYRDNQKEQLYTALIAITARTCRILFEFVELKKQK